MSWTENDLLAMMHANKDLFGEEITHIKAADDEYLVKYFERILASIMDLYTFAHSQYCVCEYCGKGDLASTNLRKEGFGLTKQRCAEIGNYIIGRWWRDHWNNPRLDVLTTIVVLNYISLGYELNDCRYKIEYVEDPPCARTLGNIANDFTEALGSIFTKK